MPKAWIWLLTAAAALPLAGCGQMAYFNPLLGDEPTKSVPAEYSSLAKGKLAIVVHTMESTQMEDAALGLDMERVVQKTLEDAQKQGNFRGLTFVSQADLIDYRSKNYYADETDERALAMARKLGADMVLWMNVDCYMPYQPTQMNFMQGRLTVNCRLIDCQSGQRKWEKPDLTAFYPPKDLLGATVATNLRETRLELIRTFGKELIDCFRRHEEPLE